MLILVVFTGFGWFLLILAVWVGFCWFPPVLADFVRFWMILIDLGWIWWFELVFIRFSRFWLILVGSGRFYMVWIVFNGLGWFWLISVGFGKFLLVFSWFEMLLAFWVGFGWFLTVFIGNSCSFHRGFVSNPFQIQSKSVWVPLEIHENSIRNQFDMYLRCILNKWQIQIIWKNLIECH